MGESAEEMKTGGERTRERGIVDSTECESTHMHTVRKLLWGGYSRTRETVWL